MKCPKCKNKIIGYPAISRKEKEKKMKKKTEKEINNQNYYQMKKGENMKEIPLTEKEISILIGGLNLRMELELHANEDIKEITKKLIEKLEREKEKEMKF